MHIYEQVYAGWERAVADAREERGEPVPEPKLEKSTTLRAKGGGSRTYEATAKEQGEDGRTFQVTVQDPDAVDEEEQQRGRRLYGEPHPIRTVEAANAAVNAHERFARARAREGETGTAAALELEAVEVLRAEGTGNGSGCCSGQAATGSYAPSTKRTR